MRRRFLVRRELARWRRDYRRFARVHADFAPWARLRHYWGQPQYRTLCLFRLSRTVRPRWLRGLLHRLYLRASRASGVEFACGPDGGVVMPHWGRIILNAEAIGRDLFVLHNVTVGHDYRSGIPTIGHHVFIGTGASILGRVHVGDHAIIGAHSLVLADVPAGTLVAGVPARVIRKVDRRQVFAMTGY